MKNKSIKKRLKVFVVCGTRPEAIKMAPVIQELLKHKEINTIVCATSQHQEMLHQVLDLFKIKLDYDLSIMRQNQSINDITVNILNSLNKILIEVTPDIVLVHGDTTTALAASLTSFYCKIKIGHIEAGLRTGNLYSPWPEEGNRKIVGSIANYHYAPTQQARKNLINEGVLNRWIKVTGNTVIDSILWINNKIDTDKKLRQKLSNKFQFLTNDTKIILITCHRRENIGKPLDNICLALKEIATKNENLNLVYPVHLNPNIRGVVFRHLSNIENIKLIDPQDYLSFVYLMRRAYFILTDSGGIQEEALSLNVPVLVLRNSTERPEGLHEGGVHIIGTEQKKIVNECNKLLRNKIKYDSMKNIKNPYGDGKAAVKIVKDLIKNLNNN